MTYFCNIMEKCKSWSRFSLVETILAIFPRKTQANAINDRARRWDVMRRLPCVSRGRVPKVLAVPLWGRHWSQPARALYGGLAENARRAGRASASSTAAQEICPFGVIRILPRCVSLATGRADARPFPGNRGLAAGTTAKPNMRETGCTIGTRRRPDGKEGTDGLHRRSRDAAG